MIRTLIVLCLSLVFATSARAELTAHFLYLKQQVDSGPVLSNILPDPEDQGMKGVELAVGDSNTTGKFLKHRYDLLEVIDADPQTLINAAKDAYAQGIRFLVVDMSSDAILALADQMPGDVLIFNAANPDDALRVEQCRASVFHTYPSRAMLADALGQWAKARKLEDILIIKGQRPEDELFAQALLRASKRFGLEVVDELTWDFDTDLRRMAQKELPLFTQTDEYDLVIVADEVGDFGEYVPFNTWYPRPVAGTQGLTPVGWHRVVEQWGAAQLQSRFEALTGRWMNSTDYAAWVAVRSVAEAITRLNTADPEAIRDFIRSGDFELAAFKGRKLTYRSWNQQLRQPISLVHPRALVSQSPQEGFLHPTSELDTLGYDKPETKCQLD